MREIADEGNSAATPAILELAVIAFIVPLAAIVITAVFLIAHFA